MVATSPPLLMSLGRIGVEIRPSELPDCTFGSKMGSEIGSMIGGVLVNSIGWQPACQLCHCLCFSTLWNRP